MCAGGPVEPIRSDVLVQLDRDGRRELTFRHARRLTTQLGRLLRQSGLDYRWPGFSFGLIAAVRDRIATLLPPREGVA
jgi:hypothetical protein